MTQYGGKREGAGRKAGKYWAGGDNYQKKVRRIFGLTPDNIKWLKEESKEKGVSQAFLVNEALEMMQAKEQEAIRKE